MLVRVLQHKITDNTTGKVIQDLIPCKNAEGVCGMYDTVGKKFYESSMQPVEEEPVVISSCSLTERQKRAIFRKAKTNGFYGSIWGSGLDAEKYPLEQVNFDDIELIKYKKEYGGKIACFGVPSAYSAEGYIAEWYFCDYGKTWALTKEELNGNFRRQ